ncbi:MULTISPECIES: alpha/beta hydrolase family protein [Glycomyces]|uniref:Alpha/beta fold hydrolase n=1 Tax=Glycomyces lechevalierae TaxID=256034 RepID=A0A9X3PJ87_9ACTN|nr:alpha/beta fold hydrolase [Glycomyces lechevalierae]MDA1385842.1 alpha/beta fold hydrolase [Glycomyces lechevalierae]MDR7339963.1 pimeloyl-ACP methyl ester carboxylesterase [Glycomyces lechevalierae]
MEPLNVEHAGRTLRGVLHLPRPHDAPVPAVVLCHGFGANRMEFGNIFVKLARDLAAQGVAAYRFDFAACGESDGDFAELTVTNQVAQVGAVLEALASHRALDPDRLSLLGMSLGGLTASLAATENPVRTLALWAPAALAVEANEPDEVEYWPEIVEKGYDDLFGQPVTRRFTEDGFGIDSWTKAAAFTGPVLLAAGTEDELFPDDVIDHYREIYADRLELHLFEDLDHCFETVPARAALVDLTAEFLLRTM